MSSPGDNLAKPRPPHTGAQGTASYLLACAAVAPLAQLAEQLTLNQRVRGSSPWRRTND